MVRDFSEERYLKEGVAKKETSHEWFYRMASQQEKEGENGVQEELYDKSYTPPSEDFY
jgi:hypothetical protein